MQRGRTAGVTLSRRAVLRGLAGGAAATVSLPLLDAMLDSHGEALAGGAPFPTRFVNVHFGNGVLLDRWTPAASGAAWELTPQLAPLAPVKAYCSILSGFAIPLPLVPHHTGMSGLWSGSEPQLSAGSFFFGARSVDQLAADAIGAATPIRSLEIGVSKRVALDGGTSLQFLSHRSALLPNPIEYNPRRLWERLFGVPVGAPSGARRGSVLGAVADDLRRLHARVGAADRFRLDAHLASVESLREQVLATPEVFPVCGTVPPQPQETNADAGGVEPLQSVADAMSALLAHAFACDLTRVASLMLTGPSAKTVFSNLGQSGESHQMTHDPVPNVEAIHDAVVWNVQQFSNLVQAIAAVPEGAGNLLDRSVVVLGSDCSEGWTHAIDDLPIVIAGGGAGALVTPGVHVRGDGRNTADVLLTALRVVAPLTTSFGVGDAASSTTVAGLLA